MVLRVLKIRISDNIISSEYKEKMLKSKEFYNSCLYLTRFRYFEYLGHKDKLDYEVRKNYGLEDWFENKDVFLSDYSSYGNEFINKVGITINSPLSAKERQTILRKVCTDWKTYFKTKEAMKNTDKRVNIPGYKEYSYLVCEFNAQMIKFRGYEKDHKIGLIGLSNRIGLPLWLKRESIQAVRLKYKNTYLYLEVIYNKNEEKQKERMLKRRVAAIDPGLNAISTITFNFLKKPISISGKHLKSVNQLYNKTVAQLNKEKSEYEKLGDKNKVNKIADRISKVTEKRNLRIENELHHISCEIVRILVHNRVSKLIFGHNIGQKEEINIGKVNNQNFVTIPFNQLIKYLEYKCKEKGITFEIQEESYTSKSSFISNDKIPTFNDNSNQEYSFSGKRVKRGKYLDRKHGIVIHSDVNGSYNIMRKNGVNLTPLQKTFINKKQTIEPVGIRLYMNK